jgi:hypothetical protein
MWMETSTTREGAVISAIFQKSSHSIKLEKGSNRMGHFQFSLGHSDWVVIDLVYCESTELFYSVCLYIRTDTPLGHVEE